MKKRCFWAIGLSVFVLLLLGCSRSSIPERPGELPLEEINFVMPEPERWELSNGIQVLYYYDDEVPQISGTIYFPGGSLYEPSGIAGLAGAVGKQMRDGGLVGMPPARLDKRLDDLAASIESSFGEEYGSVGFFCLVEDFPEVFSLFSRVVRTPAFDSSRLELWKKLAKDSVKRRRDDPSTISSMTFSRLLYGPGSPYARFRSEHSIDAVSRERLFEFHKNFVQPQGALLAISGALPKRQVREAIEREFADWPRGKKELMPLPAVETEPKPAVYLVERDFVQATVQLGHLGPPRLTSDMYEMAVFNRAFGYGGFGSVLFQNIRTQLGLAYAVWGGLAPGVKAGQFEVGMQTRVEQVGKAILEALKLIKQATLRLPDDLVFSQAKSGAERSFLFKFANPGAIVDRIAMMKLLGYPEEYDRLYLPRIKAVLREDVRRSAARWIKPEQLVIVVVGKITQEELGRQLGEGFEIITVPFDTEPRVPEESFMPSSHFDYQ